MFLRESTTRRIRVRKVSQSDRGPSMNLPVSNHRVTSQCAHPPCPLVTHASTTYLPGPLIQMNAPMEASNTARPPLYQTD